MPRRLSLPVRRSLVLQVVAVLVVFVVALVLWAGRPIGDDPIPGLSSLPEGGAGFVPTEAPVHGTSASASGSGPAAPNGPGRHTVTFTATSDAPITEVSYKVKGGSPQQRTYKAVSSPFSATVTANGDGLVGALGVKAGPDATTLTVAVAVDGRVRCTRTVKGAFAVAVCYG